MKHVALAGLTVLFAVVLGQTKTHYLAAMMLAGIRSDWLRQRGHEELRPARVAVIRRP